MMDGEFISLQKFIDECSALKLKMGNNQMDLEDNAPLALCNATRWHTTVFRSYLFLSKHIEDVSAWVKSETSPNNSMKRWLELQDQALTSPR